MIIQKAWASLCKEGSSNSPIDLPALDSYNNYINTTDYIQIVTADYSSIKDKKFMWINNQKYGLNLEDNTGQFILREKGTNYAYNLVEIVIKFGSEHTLNGSAGDCELQLVNQKNSQYLTSNNIVDEDPLISFLIFSIIFKADGDSKNNLISQIKIGKADNISGLDLNQLFIGKFYNHNFYLYSGGLTYPDCDETVHWIVFDNIEKMTLTQFTEIKDVLSINYPNGNSRKVKPFNNRTIYLIEQDSNFLFFALIIFFFYFIIVYFVLKKYFI
jgi:carbonic anhydrase